jgi:hypothetical protein
MKKITKAVFGCGHQFQEQNWFNIRCADVSLRRKRPLLHHEIFGADNLTWGDKQ